MRANVDVMQLVVILLSLAGMLAIIAVFVKLGS